MLQAVFFDLNGVLIDSEYLSDRFEREFGVPAEDFIAALKDVMAIVRKPNAPGVYSLWQPYLQQWNVELDEEQFLEFWFSGESVNQEALQYVEELKSKGIKVFVVSNNFKERSEFYRSNLPEIFINLDKAYFSWETGNVKPSKEALQLVLDEQELDPTEVVYFDDSAGNVTIAKELGIDGQEWVDLETAKKYIASNFRH